MDFDWSYEMPGYDAGNLSQYEDMPSQGGFGDWDSFDDESMNYSTPDINPWQPGQASTDLVSSPQGEYGFNPSPVSEPAPPTVGQAGRGPMEDDWLAQLKKAGTGMGVGLGTSLAGAGLQKLLAPAQKQQSLAQSQTQGQQYTPQPLELRPGTKASPLISGRPTQVRGSQGLKEKRPSYGGFSMY